MIIRYESCWRPLCGLLQPHTCLRLPEAYLELIQIPTMEVFYKNIYSNIYEGGFLQKYLTAKSR